MTLIAKFTDSTLTYEPSTRKNGRPKPVWGSVEVEDTLHPVNVEFHGKSYTFYTRGKHAKDRFPRLYHADGTPAKGIWRHGYTGSKIHEEGLEYSAETGRLMTIVNYQNGRVKDSKKYLLGIK